MFCVEKIVSVGDRISNILGFNLFFASLLGGFRHGTNRSLLTLHMFSRERPDR